jgi:glycosyltransferase involved in cell wall biosynthesis
MDDYIVGVNILNYATKRNFMSLRLKKYQFQYIKNNLYNKYFQKVINGNLLYIFEHLHYNYKPRRCDIYHFFNSISLGKTPWIVTFESFLPRWGTKTDKYFKFGMKKLASKSCVRLLPFSKNTYDIQCRYLENFPQYKDTIQDKMVVLHPPQKVLIHDYQSKQTDPNSINFVMVGHQFFRKGGMEVLRAFDRLIEKKLPIKLCIISGFTKDYLNLYSESKIMEAGKIIEKHNKNISHFTSLPNDQVMSIIKNSHIGLLPTYADTYGYFVLESQACGCPVITTNVRSLPEINDNSVGWVIKIPKDEWGNGDVWKPDKRPAISRLIEENLYQIINAIVDKPQGIKEKGKRSIQRIIKHHNIDDRAKELEKIYDETVLSTRQINTAPTPQKQYWGA